MRQASWRGQAHLVSEVAVARGHREAARQPDGRGDLGAGPEPVRHHVGESPGAGRVAHGDQHVFPGHLGDRVDRVVAAAPADVHVPGAEVAVPFGAGPRHHGQEVRRVRQLHDVEPPGRGVRGRRPQVRDQVIEVHQVAHGVQHRDDQVEPAREGEVAHVGAHDLQPEPLPVRLVAGPGAHRRAQVQGDRGDTAPGQLEGVLRRAGRELQHRSGAAGHLALPGPRGVPHEPAFQGVYLTADVAVRAGELVHLRLVVDSGHPVIVPETSRAAGIRV